LTEDILKTLGVKDLSKENQKKFYNFVIYGRYGTGKTTILTRDNDALVLDINEGGTTVVADGAGINIKNYKHLSAVVKELPNIIKTLRENGKEINVVVIETAQKLRDITMDEVTKGRIKNPTFNHYGEAANRIISMFRYIKKLQQELEFHFAITGHESTSEAKDDEGAVINPVVTLDAQKAIRDAILSESDVVARTLVEVGEQDGKRTVDYILTAEESPLFITKIRHTPQVQITDRRFKDASVNKIVKAIRNGN
jgi:hypothetical protein